MYLQLTVSLVPPPKVHHSDTNSLSRRTKTSDCTETRLSDSETNKVTQQNIDEFISLYHIKIYEHITHNNTVLLYLVFTIHDFNHLYISWEFINVLASL